MNPVAADRRDRQAAGRRLVGRSRVARCSRCSTPRRTTRSATTTWSSTSTCPTCCSSRPRTCSRRSPARCSTAWRSCSSTATPRTRRSRSPSTTSSRASARRPGCATTSSTSPTRRSTRSSQGGRARPACVRSSGSSATVARKAGARASPKVSATPIVVDEPDLKEYLGRLRFRPEDATRAPIPGLATGLAVTGAGGDVLTIEVTGMDGEPGLQVTGQLGEVMSESAQIALSFVRANADELGVADGRVRAPASSTCTCPRARCRRTARRPASR